MADILDEEINKFQPTPSARRVTWQPLIGAPRPQKFQPTPSARRVTPEEMSSVLIAEISTHTLRKEGDVFTTRTATTDI